MCVQFVCGRGKGINFESDEASLATVLFPPAPHHRATYGGFMSLPSFFMNIQQRFDLVEWSSALRWWGWFPLTYIYIVNSRYFNRSVFKINGGEAWKTAISYGFECPDVPDKFLLNHRTYTRSDDLSPSYHTGCFHFIS